MPWRNPPNQVEFASAVDALGAAIEFQQAMDEANRAQPGDTQIVPDRTAPWRPIRGRRALLACSAER
jgi:hypothetical protein